MDVVNFTHFLEKYQWIKSPAFFNLELIEKFNV